MNSSVVYILTCDDTNHNKTNPDMPPPRPNGTAPNDFIVKLKEFLIDTWPESILKGKPIPSTTEIITAKCDGFQVRIEFKNGGQVISTKTNGSYENTFPELFKVIKSRVGDIKPSQIRHRYAGEITALYGELYVLTEGQHDLKVLMDRAHMHVLPGDMIFRLSMFDCDFSNSSVKVPIAEKLDLMSKVVPVVQTLFDERDMRAIKTYETAVEYGEKVLDGIETFLNQGGEGLVAVIKTGKTLKGQRTIKHKPQRPLQLYIVAVIFEEKDGMKIPSKFAWAVRHSETCYSIVYIDEKGILCDPVRKEQHKRYIPPSSFEQNRNGSFTINEAGYAADSYNAVLRLVGNKFCRNPTTFSEETMVRTTGLKRTPEVFSIDEVAVKGIRYHIAPNRKFANMDTKFHFLDNPVKIIAGCNKLWLNKSFKGNVHDRAAAVHIQAGLVLATRDYGKEVHRDLLGMNMDAETLVAMAQTHDLPMHAKLLAECRYGEGKKSIDLIYGDADDIVESPYTSDEDLCMEEMIMLDDECKGDDYETEYKRIMQGKADRAAKRRKVPMESM